MLIKIKNSNQSIRISKASYGVSHLFIVVIIIIGLIGVLTRAGLGALRGDFFVIFIIIISIRGLGLCVKSKTCEDKMTSLGGANKDMGLFYRNTYSLRKIRLPNSIQPVTVDIDRFTESIDRVLIASIAVATLDNADVLFHCYLHRLRVITE